jgi:predicted  nucleic acid-binding Zn-ribbon protein
MKKLAILVLLLTLVLGGCSSNSLYGDLENRIDDLETRNEELESELSNALDQIGDLENRIDDAVTMISDLEYQISY